MFYVLYPFVTYLLTLLVFNDADSLRYLTASNGTFNLWQIRKNVEGNDRGFFQYFTVMIEGKHSKSETG